MTARIDLLDGLLDQRDRAFRDEVRAFLADQLPEDLRRATRRATSVFFDPAVSLAWQAILNARGWVAPDWPAEHGGTGWSEMQRYIFAAECDAADAPSLAPQGLKMVAPVIMHYGTPEQQAALLPRIVSGEDYWCQGYSEPGAGSDLASLQLRARVDGDDYVLNGSKIWTTHAQFANKMFCLVRTNAEGRPQAGITFLLLDMATPGITVHPIRTLAGEHEFNQVFFDDVRVPVSGRLGAENDGWTVAKHLLTFERGGRYAPGLTARLAELRQAAAATGWFDRPEAEARLAERETGVAGLQAIELAVLTGAKEGSSTLPSMLKILGTQAMQAIDRLAIDIAAAAPAGDLPDVLAVAKPRYLNNRASTIYAGSNEVQRNIIAGLTIDGNRRFTTQETLEELAMLRETLDRTFADLDRAQDADALWAVAVAPLGLDDLGGVDTGAAMGVAAAFGRAGIVLPWGERWAAGREPDDRAAVLDLAEAAEIVGLCETMLADTVDYLRERRQFGAPLASFQALRHRLVDMLLAFEQAAAATALATAVFETASGAAATARRLATTAAWTVGEGAVQLHGAMGLTDELRLSRYFRRAVDLATMPERSVTG